MMMIEQAVQRRSVATALLAQTRTNERYDEETAMMLDKRNTE